MVCYSIYKAIYCTERNVVRQYVGYCGQEDVRRWWHSKSPPVWMKPIEGAVLEFKIIETELPSRGVARASEAFHAVREIHKAPFTTRGGPWLVKTLQSGWRKEVADVARIRSFIVLDKYAQQHPDGNLYCHLRGLAFTAPNVVPSKQVVSRGAVVSVSTVQNNRGGRRSGVAGNDYRKGRV